MTYEKVTLTRKKKTITILGKLYESATSSYSRPKSDAAFCGVFFGTALLAYLLNGDQTINYCNCNCYIYVMLYK